MFWFLHEVLLFFVCVSIPISILVAYALIRNGNKRNPNG